MHSLALIWGDVINLARVWGRFTIEVFTSYADGGN